MSRPIRFEDAARLLAGDDGTVLKVVDQVLDVALLATLQVNLFEPKNALLRLLGDLRARAGERVRSGPRRDRGDAMVAAHTVLVIAAFFGELGTYGELAAVRWRRDDQVSLVESLVNMEPPLPTVPVPAEHLAIELAGFYTTLARRTRLFLTGLAVWDDLTETEQSRVSARLFDTTPSAAVRRYNRYVTELAGQFPGFAFWLGAWEHAATRAQVGQLRTGLADLARRLAAHTPSGDANRRWQQLARRYAADLDAPVIAGGDHGAPPDLAIPSLGAVYVDPAFRATVSDGTGRVAEDRWWDEKTTLRDDLPDFLVRHLNSPDATVRPLLVLGHPGAGKSVFTRAFAARLQHTGFRPLRVDLRRVPADAPIVDQVRVALRDALQRDVDWADLADDTGEGTPVIFFDGFDELLQGATAGRADYLERLCEFQDIAQVTRDCPVAIVVTSRTVVADRARIPAATTIIRLEPFDQTRTARWLQTWNDANGGYHTRHGLTPLTMDTLAPHGHLAAQPLLLLLLALYDATDNALQREIGAIADADLYDRLLRSFVHREMRKGREHEDDAAIDALVEQELERLAVAALAMFNRRSRQVTDDDLDADLSALLGNDRHSARGLVGRFFFVHVAEARYERTRRTYEFLHATFGEYLVAWFVTRALPQPPPPRPLTSARSEVDDALLAAVLSYDLLAFSTPTMEFLHHLLHQLPNRQQTHELLLEAFRHRFRHLPWRGHETYAPTGIDFVERSAAYSTNLVVLILLTTDEWCPLTALFGPDTPEVLEWHWRREVRLWLARHGRSSVDVLAGQLDYRLGPEPAVRLVSTTPLPIVDFPPHPFTRLEKRNQLLREPDLRDLFDGVTPLLTAFTTELQPTDVGQPAPAHALLDLLLHRNPQPSHYITAVNAAAGLPAARQDEYADLLLHRLAASDHAIDPGVLEALLRMTADNASLAFAHCLASPRLTPAERTRLASMADCAVGVLDRLLTQATVDERLVPVAVDLWRGGDHDRHEPLKARLARLLQTLPDQFLHTITIDGLVALGDLVPAEVTTRRQALTDKLI